MANGHHQLADAPTTNISPSLTEEFYVALVHIEFHPTIK
jgi:hypothetical protein